MLNLVLLIPFHLVINKEWASLTFYYQFLKFHHWNVNRKPLILYVCLSFEWLEIALYLSGNLVSLLSEYHTSKYFCLALYWYLGSDKSLVCIKTQFYHWSAFSQRIYWASSVQILFKQLIWKNSADFLQSKCCHLLEVTQASYFGKLYWVLLLQK